MSAPSRSRWCCLYGSAYRIPRYVILGCAHFVRCCGLENEGSPYALAALGFAVVPHRLAGVPWGSPVCRGGGLKCALAVVRAATVGFAKKCLSGSAPPEETRTFSLFVFAFDGAALVHGAPDR